jgi:hypothetical protein
MSPFDLTNLSALKAWLGLPFAVGSNDPTLSALITASSRSIYAVLSRPSLLPQSYTDTIDLETRRVILRQWPVLQVTSVTLCGNPVPQDTNADLEGSYGYALQPGDGIPPGRPQALDLFGLDCWLNANLWGNSYRTGRQSLVVSYTAGYAVQNEPQTAPAALPYQAAAFQPYGPWASDLGVTYAYPVISDEAQTVPASAPYQLTAMQPLGAWVQDQGVSYASSGAPLMSVAGAPTTGQYSVAAGVYTFSAGDANAAVLISYEYIPTAGGAGLALAAVKGTPAQGQYSVANGIYAFSPADAGQSVLISYGYVPQDLAQAALELAAGRFRAAERIGITSKSMGGQETIAYDMSPIPAPVRAMLQPYKRVGV